MIRLYIFDTHKKYALACVGEGGRGAGALPHALHVKRRHLAPMGSPLQPARLGSALLCLFSTNRSRNVSPLTFESSSVMAAERVTPVLKQI